MTDHDIILLLWIWFLTSVLLGALVGSLIAIGRDDDAPTH